MNENSEKLHQFFLKYKKSISFLPCLNLFPQPSSPLDLSANGLTKAVSDKFISAAIPCFSSSGMSSSKRQTAAGLPPAE